MNRIEALKLRIREAFGDVAFPMHRGLRAALAMDDWITDSEELRKITANRDFIGKWWEIPFKELQNCSLAECYFDASGTEFYLPAYMTAVLDDPVYKKYNCLLYWLAPSENDEECNLYDYFLEQFAYIKEAKKWVCIDVLEFLRDEVGDQHHGIKEQIDEILAHEFWQK